MNWYSTPCGIMRQLEVCKSAVPAHWYIDRDQKFRAFADKDCKPTRAPTWYKREQEGEKLLVGRKGKRA